MTKRLYIGNLATTTTRASLTTFFAQGGRQVATVDLVMSREIGHSRGFAFVEMATDDDGRQALQALDGAMLDGQALKVQVAAPRKSRFGGVSAPRAGTTRAQ
ncbi:MAG: RNA-binding protein [Planctomycetota bacterium]